MHHADDPLTPPVLGKYVAEASMGDFADLVATPIANAAVGGQA
jgi:hypothetical protein